MGKSVVLMFVTLVLLAPVVVLGYVAYQLCTAWAMGWHLAREIHRDVNRQVQKWEEQS